MIQSPHPITIGFLRRGYSATGGAEAYLTRLAEGLRAEGYRVVLLGTGDWPKELWPGGEVLILPHRSLREFAVAALKYKKTTNYEPTVDLLFSMERVPGCDIFRAGDGVHAAWLEHRRKDMSFWKRCLSLWNLRHREVLKLEQELFDSEIRTHVIANSSMVAQEIVEYFGFPRNRISIILNGVPSSTEGKIHSVSRIVTTQTVTVQPPPQQTIQLNRTTDAQSDHFIQSAPSQKVRSERLPQAGRLQARKSFGMKPKDFVVLFAGSGWERKGLRVAKEAVEEVILALEKDKNAKKIGLWVAGKGRTKRYVSPCVHFLGPIENMNELYAAADLFILPTRYDPFANATLEALAAGVPVITSATNGCSEIMISETHGSIVNDPNNVEGFAAALRTWYERLQNKDHAREARHMCTHLGTEWSVEKNLQATLKVIHQVLEEKN
ncbi:MAG: hypothetical protein A3F67_05925 [Verrucomicrobia bacterium RIFCSPHIGHO2_12_FULL_41_10]|nr:MAG: hypothetical protein A3F67_05925 [Verrucomicrobia bacterium RIFCSPHIGHO2_12_FULL_41_10]HLB34800.1 glycosyltransferase family 4 protein [Chthoniobacterales bacterium]